MLMEVCVDSNRHVMTDAHHSTESICTQTHVSVLSHILEALAFLLHWVVVTAETVDLDCLCLNLRCLTLTLALNESTLNVDTSASGNLLQHLIIKFIRVCYNLDVLDGRAIVQGDEVNSLA